MPDARYVEEEVSTTSIESLSAAKLLSFALKERERKNFCIADASFAHGAKSFPTYLDHYGQPAFIKELIRTILLQKDWERANRILELPDFPRDDHWYDVLFARAYEAAGITEKATEWWTKAANNYPAGWLEIRGYFKRMKMQAPQFGALEASEAMLRDQDIARAFVAHGQNETVATIERFFHHSASASKQKGAETLLKIIDNTKRRLLRGNATAKGTIPRISHRIWLTDRKNPKEPPEEYIERYLQNLETGFGTDWKHFFWLQSVDVLPRTVERILFARKNVEIKLFDKNIGYPGTHVLIEKLIDERKFALAADVAKIVCLHKHGGLYCDLGIIFNSCIDGVVEPFDYIFHLWHALFFQLSLIAMPRGCALANAYLNVINQPELFPRYMMEDPLSGSSDLSLVAGSAITALFFLLFPANANACLMISNRNLVSHSAQQTWYKSNSDMGGALISQTNPTLVAETIWNSKEEVFFGILNRF